MKENDKLLSSYY